MTVGASCTLLTRELQGVFVKYIQQETQTRVQIKGIGSGFVDQETGREADEPMYIHVTSVSHFSRYPTRTNDGTSVDQMNSKSLGRRLSLRTC